MNSLRPSQRDVPPVSDRLTELVLAGLQDHPHNADYAGKYGERGYSDPEKGILFANWNDVSQRTQDYLKAAGYELEWSDEWYVDHNHGKAWRTSPDSYGWVCAIRFSEAHDDYITPDDGAQEFIELMAIDSPNDRLSCLPDWVTNDDLIKAGFVLHNADYETGLYPGQNDDPLQIAKELLKPKGVADRVVFRLDSSGQFDAHWSAWFEPSYIEEEEAA